MWPILFQLLRSNVAYITLPVAGIVGFIGYNLENILSDKYTPYNSQYISFHSLINQFKIIKYYCFIESIQENRAERMSSEEILKNATNVEKLVYKENVLGRNLSPSLQK